MAPHDTTAAGAGQTRTEKQLQCTQAIPSSGDRVECARKDFGFMILDFGSVRPCAVRNAKIHNRKSKIRWGDEHGRSAFAIEEDTDRSNYYCC
jgi:hypothetical protein